MKIKKTKYLLAILLFCQPVFSITQNYDLEINTGEETGKQSMSVTNNGDRVEVVVIDHKKEKQVVQYKNNTELQKSEYLNADGKKFLEVQYNYANKKINVTGNVNNEFLLKPDVYDNNGSLFYLFSQIYPQKNKTMKFTMLQSKQDRTVPMYLKLVGKEEVMIDGKKTDALKYEMGLSSALISAFWPHKYYYWYAASDRRFLKYEGLGENKKVQTIQLVGYKEK